jgi:glucose-6-phosphate 1-dehydrogenase
VTSPQEPTTAAEGADTGTGPPTLVVLGAAGDLTARLLLPGLAGLVSGRHLKMQLVGSDRADWDEDQWRNRVQQAFAGEVDLTPQADTIVRTTRYVMADVTAPEDLDRLLRTCSSRPLILYFALPPAVTEQACRALTRITLPATTRLVLEKPFGTDAASADTLNQTVTRLAPEDQIYRVDHYLGLSTVLNIFGLRFTNRMLESVLDSTHVASVDILLDESLALEGRAGYYDSAGALKDVAQSHMLQLLALVGMEAPAHERKLHERKLEMLQSLSAAGSRRARYTSGRLADGRDVPAYADEEGVDPSRCTETFAEVAFDVDAGRLVGTRFVLRAGKALAARRKLVVLHLHGGGELEVGIDGPEDVVLRLAGSAAEPLALRAPAPGDGLPPYAHVLLDVLGGTSALSVSAEEAEQAWRAVAPVLDAWRADRVPLEEYAAGSDGPRVDLAT